MILRGIIREKHHFKNSRFPAPKREISKFRWEFRIPIAAVVACLSSSFSYSVYIQNLRSKSRKKKERAQSTSMLSRRGNGLKQGDRLFGSFKYWYKAGSTRTRTILGDLFSKLWYTAEVKEIKNDGTARFKSAALDNAEFDFRLDSINSSRAFSKKLPEGDILMEVNLSDETLFTDKDPIDFLKVGSKTPLEKMSKNDLVKHTQELQEKLQVSLAFVSSQLETAGHGLRVKNGMQRAQNIPALQQNVLDQIETNLTEAEVQAEVKKVASSFSLSTPDFDAYTFYRGLLAMLIDKMHASLKKTDFSTGVREGKGFKLMCPKDFMFGTFCSIARLAGFRETRRKNGVVVLTGVVENMQALGVLSDSHPKLLDPYFHCVFIASQDAVFGSYYEQFRHTCREYDYEFIVNPWDWSLASLKSDDRIKREIGHQYFDVAGDTDEMARQRIVNALVQKRIAASDPSGESAPADAGMDGGGRHHQILHGLRIGQRC